MRKPVWLIAGLIFFGMSVFAESANAKTIRLEIGAGGQGGDPEITFSGVEDDLDTDTGLAFTAGLWVDGLSDKVSWLSLGLQYLRLQDFDFSGSTILGVTVNGNIDIEPTIDGFMFNAAARKQSGKFHPFIGGGIGVARSEADATIAATVTVNGQTFSAVGSSDDDDTNFAWQFFGGADYDITEKVYAGLNLRYFGTDATLFGADVEFRNLAVMGVIGYKF